MQAHPATSVADTLADRISRVNHALAKNLRPQPTAMDQPLDHRLARDLLQMTARFAQPYSTNAHVADRELFAHKMIECDTSRDKIAARVPGSQFDAVFATQSLNRLRLNQRERSEEHTSELQSLR